MRRRTFLAAGLACLGTGSLSAAVRAGRWDEASAVLERAVEAKQVDAAVLHVRHRGESFTRAVGAAATGDAMFLLGSISKPINVAAVLTQFDRGVVRLDDRVQKFLPDFRGEGCENVTLQHLLTHTSGLPDQLADNAALRKQHASLDEFVERTVRTPLAFAPGTRYQYSSMGILLACRMGEVVSGRDIHTLVDEEVFQPLDMNRSANGLGRFRLEDLVACQSEGAAPESGSGDPSAGEWNWNSRYWRALGAPWGGTHASAPDVGQLLDEMLHARGRAVRPSTARLMTTNRNPAGLKPRGLGFDVGREAGSEGCSARTFGHTGSTGTLCWADPASDTICVVLTSLPRRAAAPHPRELAAERVAVNMTR